MPVERKPSRSTSATAVGSERAARRSELADALADIVLAEGLGDLGLRGVAAKLGTSDRMLIYYFETKEQLVLEMLDKVGTRLTAILVANSDAPRVSPGQFLSGVLALSTDPAIAPFMRLWTEVIARGARGETPYDQVGAKVVRSWMTWIESRLIDANDPAEKARPAALLSIVEGISLLELAAPGSTKDVQPYLTRMLDAVVPTKPATRRRRPSST
ncbi:TetR/AcrR family transcriptional regulator [Lichenicoccus roseus]|uniref:TetR/AcrR family transcriptional regulator n=1 Tax=Lichenicoccus roseus TaxID=2683649 RepID=A0A5R9IZC3_9PROT|nr:TetR/AcrR family transcriptional regulator [Lichenicoccus roseus]TLU70652.1 TetR/AcrR family transcriptional regulator [Lichenicoccus roseus]